MTFSHLFPVIHLEKAIKFKNNVELIKFERFKEELVKMTANKMRRDYKQIPQEQVT